VVNIVLGIVEKKVKKSEKKPWLSRFFVLRSSMIKRENKVVLEKNIKDGVLKFIEHLNNTMDKPDGYEYELNTRGSKYFKVEMTSHGNHRSVYCFI